MSGGGSGDDDGDGDAPSWCASSGDEAGMLVTADTGSADEAYQEFLRETASPDSEVVRASTEQVVPVSPHQAMPATPEQVVDDSEGMGSGPDDMLSQFEDSAEDEKKPRLSRKGPLTTDDQSYQLVETGEPQKSKVAKHELQKSQVAKGKLQKSQVAEDKLQKSQVAEDKLQTSTAGEHSMKPIEISDSPVVKLEKTQDFSPISNSPRFKEVKAKLKKLKQLQEAKRLKLTEKPGPVSYRRSVAAAPAPGFWEKPASDHDDTQCMSAADLDDLAGKFRVSASAIDEAALSEIGMVHSLRFISE
eukprot:s6538_g11.t1